MITQVNKNNSWSSCLFLNKIMLGVVAVVAVLFPASRAFAQATTNAYDTAADSAYANAGDPNANPPGNGLTTGLNGGYGFGAWTVTTNGVGNAFRQTFGPSGNSFDLWNANANGSTIAVRTFGSPLSPGQSFSVQFRLNGLDQTYDTNMIALQDSSGNTLFSYWHVGGEPNGATNGEYSDASTSLGSAVGFSYDYQQFCSFTFTLNSATSYTFTDNTTGQSFTGTISGTIAQVAFIRSNGGPNAPYSGDDLQADELEIVSSAPPTFTSQSPVPGSYSASRTNISVQVVDGSLPINTNTVVLKVDGGVVSPASITRSINITTISCILGSPLSPGVEHTAQVTLADSDNNLFTNTWSFTTGFPSLPATLPGPITVSNSVDVPIFTAAGDGWVGTNYQSNSSKTLYTRFSMEFNTTNDTGSIYTWGGLEFWQDNTERFLIGKSGGLPDWSVAAINGYPDTDIPPSTQVNTDEWHTFVVRVDYSPDGSATAEVWLDPDFSQTEANQPNPPLTLALNNTFNNIRLRCGYNDASATYSNVIIAATSAGVGFVAPSAPQFQSFVPAINASAAPTNTPIGVNVLFGTYGISTNAITMILDGNTVTPNFTAITNPAPGIAINYQPPAPFMADSPHSVEVDLTDSNGTFYSTSWGFTVDPYPSLPVSAAPGEIDVFNGNDDIIFNSQNEWIGDNYGASSTNTLYVRFSMTFYNLNGETGNGGGYGGLEFYLGNTEHLLVGNNWLSTNWSVATPGDNGGIPSEDIPPVTPIVLGEWHTFVIKNVYSLNTNTTVEVWMDPDFTKSEYNQPNPPLTLSMTNTFDNIHLRGYLQAGFTNVVIAATAQGVGFAAAAAPGVLSIQKGQLSWTGDGTLQTAPAVTGPWTDAFEQINPQMLSMTNSAEFFRLRQ